MTDSPATKSINDDKPSVTHLDRNSASPDNDVEGSHGVDAKEEARIMRKVDWRLIPVLSVLYSISLIDRTNISVARVAGMALPAAQGGLHLTINERYSLISLIFFVTYTFVSILFELPSNILLRKLGARLHMTGIVVSWGAVMLGMGFVTNWVQLLVLRAVLGVFEAGFFPACLFLITSWYTRYETQRRLAAFYGFSLIVSGFSNIMGYGISLLKGQHNLEGWRWIFIVYGAITVGLGLTGGFLIVDFPDKATFLPPAEIKVVRDRIDRDRGDSVPDAVTLRSVLHHLTDIKMWAYGVCFACITVGPYAFSFFLPIILGGGGYSDRLSLILSAPPYILAFIWVMTSATIADKTQKRAAILVLNATITIVGLILMGWGGKIGVRYLGCFIALSGCQANVPTAASYQANNICSLSKRAVGSALLVGGGGVGGIIASLIFRQQDFPNYIPGIAGTISFQVLLILVVGALTVYYKRQNRLADEGKLVLEGNPDFRYTI